MLPFATSVFAPGVAPLAGSTSIFFDLLQLLLFMQPYLLAPADPDMFEDQLRHRPDRVTPDTHRFQRLVRSLLDNTLDPTIPSATNAFYVSGPITITGMLTID